MEKKTEKDLFQRIFESQTVKQKMTLFDMMHHRLWCLYQMNIFVVDDYFESDFWNFMKFLVVVYIGQAIVCKGYFRAIVMPNITGMMVVKKDGECGIFINFTVDGSVSNVFVFRLTSTLCQFSVHRGRDFESAWIGERFSSSSFKIH